MSRWLERPDRPRMDPGTAAWVFGPAVLTYAFTLWLQWATDSWQLGLLFTAPLYFVMGLSARMTWVARDRIREIQTFYCYACGWEHRVTDVAQLRPLARQHLEFECPVLRQHR